MALVTQEAQQSTAQPQRRWPTGRQLLVVFVVCLAAVAALPWMIGNTYTALGVRALEQRRSDITDSERAAQALVYFDQAQRWSPDNAHTYRNRAQAYTLQQQPTQTVAMLEQAYRLEPASLQTQRDLAVAYQTAGQIEQAQALWDALGVSADTMIGIGDSYAQHGELQQAEVWYTRAVWVMQAESQRLWLRLAAVAAARGEHDQTAAMLERAATPSAVLKSVERSLGTPGADGLFPTGITVGSVPQQIAGDQDRAFYGTGWYGPDPAVGRWARSPAEIVVFSPNAGAATLQLWPSLYHDPAAASGLGGQGVFTVTVNGTQRATYATNAGTVQDIPLELQAGWNTIQLQLAAGNFRPSDYARSGTGDTRVLSFALAQINIVQR